MYVCLSLLRSPLPPLASPCWAAAACGGEAGSAHDAHRAGAGGGGGDGAQLQVPTPTPPTLGGSEQVWRMMMYLEYFLLLCLAWRHPWKNVVFHRAFVMCGTTKHAWFDSSLFVSSWSDARFLFLTARLEQHTRILKTFYQRSPLNARVCHLPSQVTPERRFVSCFFFHVWMLNTLVLHMYVCVWFGARREPRRAAPRRARRPVAEFIMFDKF